MQHQLDLFTGQELRDAGIKQSMETAEKHQENWTHFAYQFLLNYTKANKEFMAEDVRNASEGIVQSPPSKRAWGGIFVKAVKSGLIERIGFRNVKNANAHCTPASLWKTI